MFNQRHRWIHTFHLAVPETPHIGDLGHLPSGGEFLARAAGDVGTSITALRRQRGDRRPRLDPRLGPRA